MKPSLARCLSMLCMLALPAIAAAPGDTASSAPVVRRAAMPAEHPDRARVIVRFKADSSFAREAALAATPGREPRVQHAARLSQRLGMAMTDGDAVMPRTQVLHARGLRSSELVARLLADPEVENAWVDERVRATAAPNDPRYPGNQTTITPPAGQWYLRAPDTSIVSAINAEGAWDVTKGSPAIVVAVLDTGVRPDHPDFAGKLLPGYDFVSPDDPGTNRDFSTANDGDGRDADPSDPGDWVSAAEAGTGAFLDCGASPSSWHGTQTAGLVGAATNNAIGIAGSGRDVRILPVRVLGKCGGFLSDVVAGMLWAAGLSNDPVVNPNPARVINLSLGSTGPCAGTLYEAAISQVAAAGVVVAVAAGNDFGLAVGRPANCAGAIGVGGLRHVGSKVAFSDVGPQISISAPGGNCVNLTGVCLFPMLTTTNSGTTTPGINTYSDGFNESVGTSFSSPVVAGTAALMLSINPALNATQVRAQIMSTARAFPVTGSEAGTVACHAPDANEQFECYCTTNTCGAGMLDARAAVLQAASTRVTTALAFATPANPLVGNNAVLDGSSSVVAPSQTISTYAWTLVIGASIAQLVAPTNAATVTVTTTGSGSFTARLTITDSAGATASVDKVVVVSEPPPASGGGGGALPLIWVLLLAAVAWRLHSRD